MRFLLKILFAPILAALAIVTWFFVFVVSLSSGILCIPAVILGFFGLFIPFVDPVSYGVGLRLNFNFFILRLDGGMKAIDPTAASGPQHYVIAHPNFKRDFALHFAVGLPF